MNRSMDKNKNWSISQPKINLQSPKVSNKKQNYFCHYNNAMYMGSIQAFKKNKIGLLVTDDGSIIITSFISDVLKGHNIIFRNGSILSIIYKSDHAVDTMLRIHRYMIQITFTNQSLLKGNGYIFDFGLKIVYQISTNKDQVVYQRVVSQESPYYYIFKNMCTEKYFDKRHFQALNLTFQKPKGFQIIKQGHKITMGYFKNKQLNGLGTKIFYRYLQKNPEFEIQIIESGYYSASKLNGYGSKKFNNNNQYFGYLKDDQFHGKGLLYSFNTNKWIFGEFSEGQLKQIKQISQSQDCKNYTQKLKTFHNQSHKLIDLTPELPNSNKWYAILMNFLENNIFLKTDEHFQHKQEDLKINIKDSFVRSNCNNIEQIYKDYCRVSSINKKQKDILTQSKSQKNSHLPKSIQKAKTHIDQKKYEVIIKSPIKNKIEKKSLSNSKIKSYEKIVYKPKSKKLAVDQSISPSSKTPEKKKQVNHMMNPVTAIQNKKIKSILDQFSKEVKAIKSRRLSPYLKRTEDNNMPNNHSPKIVSIQPCKKKFYLRSELSTKKK